MPAPPTRCWSGAPRRPASTAPSSAQHPFDVGGPAVPRPSAPALVPPPSAPPTSSSTPRSTPRPVRHLVSAVPGEHANAGLLLPGGLGCYACPRGDRPPAHGCRARASPGGAGRGSWIDRSPLPGRLLLRRHARRPRSPRALGVARMLLPDRPPPEIVLPAQRSAPDRADRDRLGARGRRARRAALLAACDRLVAMDLGRVIADGPPAAVVAAPAVVASYLGTSDVAVARSGSARRPAPGRRRAPLRVNGSG